MSQMIHAPVVIVGGGMVGLTLALMLAQQQIEVTLLEAVKYPAPQADGQPAPYHSSFDARNTALSRRTVQIFSDLGLWQQLQQYATPILQVQISELGSFGKARLNAHEEKVESFGQVIENAWLGRVLLAAVHAEPRITLMDGVVVKHLSQDQQQVTVQATQQQGATTLMLQVQTPLLIAADGRDSFCRQALGVGASVHEYQQVALVTTVQTSDPHGQVAFERFTPQGPLALLPLAGSHRRSVVWTVPWY